MKIKPGFRLRHIADSWLIVPTGAMTKNVPGVLNVSESGAQIWKDLEGGTDETSLVKHIMDEYDVDEATASVDVKEFLSFIRERGWIDE